MLFSSRCSKTLWILILLVAFLLLSRPVRMMGQNTNERIVGIQQLIQDAEARHLPLAQQGELWAELALAYWNGTDLVRAEDAYSKSLRLLKTDPSKTSEYASRLEDLASLYLSYGRVAEAEATAKQAFAVRKKVGEPVNIAISQIHMANIALARHQFKKAEQLSQRGSETLLAAANPPKTSMLSGFITLAYARCSDKHCSQGFRDAQQAVAYAEKNFASETAPIGFSLETRGYAEWKSGAKSEAEKDMQEAIRILRRTLVPADPRLAGVMLQYRSFLVEAERPAEARDIQQEVSSMTRQAGIYCPNCAVGVNTLARGMQ
jgi:tetratricopeptide (TPR) repeat protein